MIQVYQKLKALYQRVKTMGNNFLTTTDSDKGIQTDKAEAMEQFHTFALFFKLKQPSPTPESLTDKEGAIPIINSITGAEQLLAPPREWNTAGSPAFCVSGGEMQNGFSPASILSLKIKKTNDMRSLYFSNLVQVNLNRTSSRITSLKSGEVVLPFLSKQNYAVRLITCLILLLVMQSVAWAQTNGDYRSRATGAWNASGTWSIYNNGWQNASNYPGQNSGTGNVLIQNGNTVTINASVPNAIGALTVGGGTSGILYITSTSAITLTISGDVSVIAGGNFAVQNATNDKTHNVNIGGNLTVNGSFNMSYNSSGNTTDDNARVTFNGGSQQTISGSGTTCVFNSITISNSGNSVILGRNITLTDIGSNSAGLSINSGAFFDLGSYTCNRSTSGAGSFIVNSGATLKIGGTNSFPSNYSTNTVNATSTIEYNGSDQSIANLNYGNLVLSGSGTKTFGSARTISGNLSISDAVANLGAFTHSANSLTLGGDDKPAGSWGSTSSAATFKTNAYFASTGIVNVATGPAIPVAVFSGLTASQSVCPGAATVTLGGVVSAGAVYPAIGETVGITINGITQNTTITGSTGEFSIDFNTSAIPASETPYPVTYSYAGGTYLSAAANNNTTSITVSVPLATVNGQSNISCFGGTDGSITISASGGTAPYSYSVDNGSNWVSTNDNPYTYGGLHANTQYKIRVKDSQGCTSPAIP